MQAVLAAAALGSAAVVRPAATVHSAQSCSAVHVNAAIARAAEGDTVAIPPCTSAADVWGATEATAVSVNKNITLKGAGADLTKVVLGATTAVLIDASGATVRDFRIITKTGTTSAKSVFFSTDGACQYGCGLHRGLAEWRVTGMVFDQGSSYIGYIFNVGKPNNTETRTWGLVDGNKFLNMKDEQLNWRGPCDSWDTPTNFGGAAALFLENNIFAATAGSSAYLDSNSNARIVARYNVFDNVYLDMHGLASDYDTCHPEKHEGVRSVEAYNNRFVNNTWMGIYIRGGTGLIHNNVVDNPNPTAARGGVWMQQYCATGGPWGPVKTYYSLGVCCKNDYPVKFQIGRGMGQASEPIFIWDNEYTGSNAPVNISYGYSNGAAGENNKKLCNDPELWFDSSTSPTPNVNA